MNTVPFERVIGIDVSRDWLDIHCLPDRTCLRVPNAPDGHARVVSLARRRDALVCFEATGGQEWRLWAALDAAQIVTRQLPPAQVKAFAASRGTRAKTDRIDAELIARFMVFRPEAGRSHPARKLRSLRALTSKRSQLVEMRKRLLAQIKAHQKLGTAELFEDIDAELKITLDTRIAELEERIAQAIADDDTLAVPQASCAPFPGSVPSPAPCFWRKCPNSEPSQGNKPQL